MNSKLISIIVPIFNAGNFLEETIESVLQQTYTNWELLLIDDGSTDSSPEIALRYAGNYPDKVRYLEHENHENRGACASRNLGISQAKGEYIALLDSDDVWIAKKLEQQSTILDSHPDVGMIYGTSLYWKSWTGNSEDAKADFVSELGMSPDRVYRPPDLITRCYPLGKAPPPCPSDVLLRRAAIQGVGGFEESWRGKYQLYEDQAFFVKIYLQESVYASGQCWDKYRLHPDSCVSVVTKAGQYDAVRLFFLEWFEKYLVTKGIKNKDVWDALRKALVPYRHPILFYFSGHSQNLARRMKISFDYTRMILSAFKQLMLRRKMGMILAHPNPVRVADDSGVGITKLLWTSKDSSAVEVHVGSPDGPLFSDFSPSGRATTGKWVSDGMKIYLQDTSRGQPLTPEHTLASVKVDVISAQKWSAVWNRFKLAAKKIGPETNKVESTAPSSGSVRFGDLRRTDPISQVWGFDRGTAIDRYYIENFLTQRSTDIQGRVLEIDENMYTARFGGKRVTQTDILSFSEGNPKATIVADLVSADHVPSNTFDCIIFTQTLQFIYDIRAAIRTLHRILKPNGVLLATFPGISRTWDPGWKDYWFWNFTPTSAQRLFQETFSPENLTFQEYGNVLASICFLHGLAAEELQPEELHQREKGYEVLLAIRAVK